MNMAREWLEAQREQVFAGHDVIARFGALTLTRCQGRLWLFLEITPIMTHNDTEDGRARMTKAIGVLTRDLCDVSLELGLM